MKKNYITRCLDDAVKAFTRTIDLEIDKVIEASEIIASSLNAGNKLIFFGNGGSAADSQHLAAEFVNRFQMERRPLPALALTTDTSVLTAISNDYDFTLVFSKQIEALVKEGDVAIGISTSGTSPNVIKGLVSARMLGAKTIAFTGRDISQTKHLCDIVLSVSSADTPRIQEVHIFLGHVICGLVEKMMFSDT